VDGVRVLRIAVIGVLLMLALGCAEYYDLPPTAASAMPTAERVNAGHQFEQSVVPTATAAPRAPTTAAGLPETAAAHDSALIALQSEVERVYAEASPAVVHITTRLIMYNWFNQAIPQEDAGSGFVFDDRGHIVTNYHVVAGAEEITVALADGAAYPATVVGLDPSTDLAVLRIDADDLPAPLPLADSDDLRVGQFVVAIGNPFGLERTMTFGIISALGRVIETPNSRFVGEAIQTDAATNPGNSGGPLLDLDGRVVGVNSQIISSTQASAGIGFAVSSNTVRRVVPHLIAHGRYPHPWLGVVVMTLTPERVATLNRYGAGIPVTEGVLVLSVDSGSPAEAAGIRGGQRIIEMRAGRFLAGGDIIIALDDQPITNERDLRLYLDTKTQVGQELAVTFIRGDEVHTAMALLAPRPDATR